MTNKLLITGATVYLPDRLLRGGSVLVEEGRIAGVFDAGKQPPETDLERIDASGMLLVPGFIDLHVHGGGGVDMMDASTDKEAVDRMSRYHAAHGTTSFLPTTMTAGRDEVLSAIGGVKASTRNGTGGAQVLGIHLEGPFLNPKRCGAQNPEAMRLPTREEIQAYLEAAGGLIKLITLAPEQGDALELIGYLRDNGVTVSIGHSDADAATVKKAVKAGATHVTHLFNGMSPLHHREPGVAGSALVTDELSVELICDGLHLHPDVISMVYRVKPHDRIVLVTDSIEAAGCPDGDYELGGLPIIVKAGKAVLKNGGNLAGSCLTTGQALKNTMAFTGLPLEKILPGLTINPAKQIGADSRKGSIEIGKDADLVLLDGDCAVRSTFVKGVRVHG